MATVASVRMPDRSDFLPNFRCCAVPIDQTSVSTMYVFVEIGIDVPHLVDSILLNFPPPPSSSASPASSAFPAADSVSSSAPASSTSSASSNDSSSASPSASAPSLTLAAEVAVSSGCYSRLVLAGTIQFTAAVQVEDESVSVLKYWRVLGGWRLIYPTFRVFRR